MRAQVLNRALCSSNKELQHAGKSVIIRDNRILISLFQSDNENKDTDPSFDRDKNNCNKVSKISVRLRIRSKICSFS
jgi:hypothetical protein